MSRDNLDENGGNRVLKAADSEGMIVAIIEVRKLFLLPLDCR
jgi:hypothetical protein